MDIVDRLNDLTTYMLNHDKHGIDVCNKAISVICELRKRAIPTNSNDADTKRLDWLAERGAFLTHTQDGDYCNVWLSAERDGTESRPAEGYPQKRHNSNREAIDAAMKEEK